MKTFEERFTAWVDGQLEGDELTAFEKELAAHPEAESDRAAAVKIGDLLRTHTKAPMLSNADFFNLQIQQRIEAEMPCSRRTESRRDGGVFWSPFRLLWAGAACLVLAGLLFRTTIPTSDNPAPSEYFAQVVEAWPSDPSISATTVYNPQDNVTVLWLDGLEYMPGDQLALQ